MPERKLWTEDEDKALRFLKEEEGLLKWSVISRRMHLQFGIEGRTGKQCRERLLIYYKDITIILINQFCPMVGRLRKRKNSIFYILRWEISGL